MVIDIQIASDLHLEYNKDIKDFNEIITPSAPIIVLAGDIGNLYTCENLRKFLAWCCNNFIAVIYIPGNHEYYTIRNCPGKEKYQLDNILYDIQEEFSNLYILTRKCIKINDI